MSFRLQRGEGIDDGLHRIMDSEFESIELELRTLQLQPDNHNGGVHETRKHVKKLRAVCRLFRSELGKDWWKREHEVLGDIGRVLSPARDAEVKVQLLSDLLERHPSPKMTKVVHHWEVQCTHAVHELLEPSRMSQVLTTLEASHSRFDLFPLSASGWALLQKGLRKSYKRACEGMELTHGKSIDEAKWHTWRKRCKVLQYQLTLLEHLGKPVAKYLETLDGLTEALGREHDFQVLAATLENGNGTMPHPPDRAKLLKRIQLQRSRLQKKAHRLGEELLAKKPGKFVDHIHKLWKRW